MPVFLKDEKAVLFVHIPKAAGSSLERVFVRSGWEMGLRETRRSAPRLFPLRRCSPQHYHADLLRELFDVERFDVVFTVTREPVSRFRSEYLMRHKVDPRTDAAAVDAWAEHVLERRRHDPYLLDNHLRPQHEFVLPGSLVYRLEDGLEPVVDDLAHRLGTTFPEQLPRALDSAKRTGVRSSDLDLSPQLVARLHEVYAQDFARLGYS